MRKKIKKWIFTGKYDGVFLVLDEVIMGGGSGSRGGWMSTGAGVWIGAESSGLSIIGELLGEEGKYFQFDVKVGEEAA